MYIMHHKRAEIMRKQTATGFKAITAQHFTTIYVCFKCIFELKNLYLVLNSLGDLEQCTGKRVQWAGDYQIASCSDSCL